MKTQEEIQIEIRALKAIRPIVLPRSVFGDDNLAALDAQIQVLEDDLDNEDIYDRFEDSDHVLDSALFARSWMDGDEEDFDLAGDWPLN